MSEPNKLYVYHGSHELFDLAIPKRQIRKGLNPDLNGEKYITVFDDISFHATPYKWIALNYICQCQNVIYQGKEYWHATGVDLRKYKEEIEVFGVESLEKSLEVLFGQGGYLFTFNAEDFIHQEGLGINEVIAKSPVKPISIERIDNPVSEIKKLGIPFVFKDLMLPENNW
jgi:hypothetical protein